MINSAQRSEGVAYAPEKKDKTLNYETKPVKVVNTHKSKDISDPQQPLNQFPPVKEIDIGGISKTTSTALSSSVAVSKFVTEVKTIFNNFVSGLSQFAVPTKNAQELT